MCMTGFDQLHDKNNAVLLLIFFFIIHLCRSMYMDSIVLLKEDSKKKKRWNSLFAQQRYTMHDENHHGFTLLWASMVEHVLLLSISYYENREDLDLLVSFIMKTLRRPWINCKVTMDNDHLIILILEWALPSAPKNDPGSEGTVYRSGYGKSSGSGYQKKKFRLQVTLQGTRRSIQISNNMVPKLNIGSMPFLFVYVRITCNFKNSALTRSAIM